MPEGPRPGAGPGQACLRQVSPSSLAKRVVLPPGRPQREASCAETPEASVCPSSEGGGAAGKIGGREEAGKEGSRRRPHFSFSLLNSPPSSSARRSILTPHAEPRKSATLRDRFLLERVKTSREEASALLRLPFLSLHPKGWRGWIFGYTQTCLCEFTPCLLLACQERGRLTGCRWVGQGIA